MRLGAQPFLWKWVLFAWEWKMISISKAEHLPSFWNRGPGELGNGLLLAKGVSDYVRDKVSRGTPEAVPSLVRCNLRFVFRKIQHLFGHLHRNFLPKPGGSTRKERVQESEMCNNYTKIIKLHIVWAMSTKDEIWFDDAPMKFSVFIA